jgi:hypothetical protein
MLKSNLTTLTIQLNQERDSETKKKETIPGKNQNAT